MLYAFLIAVSIIVGWIIRGWVVHSRINTAMRVIDDVYARLDDATQQRDFYRARCHTLEATRD